jgi:hypothetical protein
MEREEGEGGDKRGDVRDDETHRPEVELASLKVEGEEVAYRP